MPATIKIWVPELDDELGPGVNENAARHDVLPGMDVFVENVAPGAVNTCEILWAPKNGAGASPGASSWTWNGYVKAGWFFNIPNGTLPGSYRIKVTTDDTFVIREISILSPKLGLRIPALGSRCDPDATLQNTAWDFCENAVAVESDGRFQGGVNYAGHYLDYENLIFTLETLAEAIENGNAKFLQGRPVADADADAGLYLMGTGAGWAPSNLNILGYSVLGTPIDGQILMFMESEDPPCWMPTDPPSGSPGGSSDAESIRGVPVIGAPINGQALVYTSSEEGPSQWQPGAPFLMGFPVVNDGELVDGSTLAFKSETNTWGLGTGDVVGGGGDATSIQGIDVDSATPSEGDVLQVVGGVWVAHPPDNEHLVEWVTAFDVNFTELSGQTITNGNNTIAGKVFSAENIASAASAAAVNVNGLQLTNNTTSTDFNYNTRSAALVSLILSNVLPSSWTSADELRIYGRFTTDANQNYEFARFGLETQPTTVNSRNIWDFAFGYSAGLSSGTEAVIGTAQNNQGATVLTGRSVCILRKGNGDVFYYSKAVTVADSDPNDTAFDGDLSTWTLEGVYRGAAGLSAGTAEKVKTASSLALVFAASTVNTSGSHVATLKRLRVQYQRAAAAATVAVAAVNSWKTYCDFNFTQLPNRAINADGDLVIDGVTMTAGNTQTGASTMNIVNGSGLVIAAANTTNTFWYHTAHSATWLGIDLNRLPGWLLELAEVRIFSEWYLTVGTANFATAGFGFTKRLNFSGNDWSPMIRQVYAGGQSRSVHYVYAATEDYKDFSNTYNVGMAHYRGQYNLAFYGKAFAGAVSDSNGSAFDDLTSLKLVARHTEARGVGAGARVTSDDGAMAFVCGQNGNTSGNTVCTFRRLRIQYKL